MAGINNLPPSGWRLPRHPSAKRAAASMGGSASHQREVVDEIIDSLKEALDVPGRVGVLSPRPRQLTPHPSARAASAWEAAERAWADAAKAWGQVGRPCACHLCSLLPPLGVARFLPTRDPVILDAVFPPDIPDGGRSVLR